MHEKQLAELITTAVPGVLVTCSHQVAREFREFERASTTLLSAYVQPVIDGYLHRFESKLAGAGFTGRFTVMQSNGGRLPAEAMRQSAITALYSGPAAGVVGASRVIMAIPSALSCGWSSPAFPVARRCPGGKPSSRRWPRSCCCCPGSDALASTPSVPATWTARETNRMWYSVASSADGTKLVSAVDGGQAKGVANLFAAYS